MMTLSKALTAGQTQKYYEVEYTNARESYYSENQLIDGEWYGRLAEEWGLNGCVDKKDFIRLSEGQDPQTSEQLVRHVNTKEYENQYGEKVQTTEHRAGYDATFSAPKSVSLAALVGDDQRIRDAHRKAVKTALGELEKYTQARMGGDTPAQTTRNFAAALFEHDAARPDKETGYAAPQLHTHAVIFNLTRLDNSQIKPIQPIELYRSQKYATAIYRSILGEELQKLGYQIRVDSRTGAPEIRGFSEEYLVASSPRRGQIKKEASQIKERFAQQGVRVKDGAGLNQAAAKLDRKSKRYDRTQMRARHREMDARFDNEAAKAVESALERGPVVIDDEDLKKRAQAAVTFARQNASAREAVVDKRNVMVDALRRNLTFTTHEAIVQELDQRVQSGEFIAIQRFDRFEELTTSHMLALERSNIHQMLAGRNTQEPMMQRKEASRVIKEIVEKTGKKSSFDQYKAVGQILVSRDRVFALEGLAGTGKTTTLAILREALERQGFAVRGLAPTGRAADKLAESGIRTTTLQGFLKSPELTIGRDDERSLYVLDESSLSDTKNLHLFLKKAGLQSRILLVGDPAQHQAVEAGAPFEQLLKAGIRFARLDKILRQQSNLKKPVELLSKKEAAAAVALLETQGRITEITDDIDRLKAIATDYVNNPKSTLIISPANSERVAINNLIHHKLQQRGTVGHENHRITVLVNRQDMTGPERTFALAYVPGEDIIRYNTTSKLYGVKSGDYGRIKANDHKENTITVRFENGRELTYNPERLSGVSVYREAERDFAVGDRVQFRAPFSPGKVKNSELGTVKEITDDEMIVRLDKKRDVAINLTRFRHLDHGYAVTSHSSQGQTVNRVLVNAETSETELLVNQRMAYVAISRARFEARVYTDSLKDLGPAFNREKNKEIAIDALKQSQSFSCAQQSLQTQSTASTTENLVASQNISTSRNAGKEKAIPFSERMRDLNHRLILGERLSASLNEKYAAEKLEQVLESRNVRRYLVMDQTIGLRRELSIHDVERRAMSVAGRVAEEQVSALDGSRAANMYRWKELRALEYANQIEQHHSTINEIHEAHEEEVRKLTQSLQGARQINLRATLAANSIESSIQSNGQSPLPIIPHERLNELQQSAIRYRDVDEFKVLEKIRDGLPHELGGLGRDDYSFARLKGQALVADSNVRVAEKRIEEFEKTRHFAKFEIDGEEWSLVRIDRATRLAERQIEFHRGEISSYRWRIYGGFQNPWKLRNIGDYRKRVAVAKECIATACNETRDLQPIREEVLRLIEEHRLDLKKTAAEEKCLSRTLDQSLEREVALRLEHRPELPSPQLNAQEIKRLDDNSVALRDKQMLHLVDESLESQFGQTQVARKNLAARAIGRALAADISVKDLTLRIDQFPYIRQFYPVLIKDADGAEKTASLNDLRPRSLTEKALSYFSAKDRFEINVINQTLDEHHADLLSQRDLLDQFAKVTRASAQDYGESLLTLDQPLPLPQTSMTTPLPQFTLRELSHLENFAAQQSDAAVRAQFENIIVSSMFGSAFNEFTSFSRNIDLGFDLTQMAASDSAHLRFQKDDNLEANTNTIEKVSVESAVDQVTVNEAAVTVETDAVSETWAELL